MSPLLIGIAAAVAWIGLSACILYGLTRHRDRHPGRGDWENLP